MESNVFKFKLIDVLPFKKGDSKMARLVVYCSYGFIVNMFTTEEKSKSIYEKAKLKNFDITEFVYVFYDNKTQKFAYVINTK